MACNKQIVLAGKGPVKESFIMYNTFTEIEVTCSVPNKYLDLLKVKQKYVTLPHPTSTQ